MKCDICGNDCGTDKFCNVCGNEIKQESVVSVENIELNNEVQNIASDIELPKTKSGKNKKSLIIIIILLILIIISSIYLYIILTKKNVDNKTISTINTIKTSDDLKFKLNDKEYYIGEKVDDFIKDGFVIVESNVNNNMIYADSIVVRNFYYKNVAMFSGALYCASENDCSYNEAKLIKANFYEDSKVELTNGLKFGLRKNKVNEILGDETGNYYQDSAYKVWSNGNKIGDYYYIVRYDTGGLFSLDDVDKLEIGIWWYEGEMERTIVKEEIKDEKDK